MLTARAIAFEVGDSLDHFVDERLNRYDGAQLIEAEDLMESERLTRLSQYRQRYIDGPTLDLPFKRMSVQFDPGTVDALDDVGKVYPSLRLTDVWGELTVDGGALIAADWSKAVVPAPSAETATGYTGDGYVLTLNDGWLLVAGVRRGDRVVWQYDSTAPQEVSLETGDGVTLSGDLYMAHGASAPLILLFHQGASNARAEYLPVAPRLIDAGFNLLAIDQRRGGDRFGGLNRTVSRTTGNGYSYCDCYADLEAALRFAHAELEANRIIAWGSSYSAALVFRLGVEHAEDIDRILAFSPASGEPMDGCQPEPFASQIEIPALVLRPAREMELEHVAAQFRTLSDMGHRMYVADPAVHGSSMLNPNRVKGDIEPTWQTVLQFLAPDE